MRNYIDSGDAIAVTAPRALASGEGCLVGTGMFGFAVTSALISTTVVLERKGRFSHAKTSAQAWVVGDLIYWDDTNHVLTTTSAGNTLVGVATAIAANPSATGTCVLK
jgi:predicted RecA/RadA family phage recombinase